MRVTYIKLENVAGLMVGSSKPSIEIDFSQSTNKIISIQGRNGVGKTVLISSIHPFSYVGSIDDRSNLSYILKGKNGYKEIHYQDGEDTYVIKHYFKATKESHSVKSYFLKNGTELNENGNVTSFLSLVEETFGLTPEMMRLIRIGSNVNSFISLQPAKRKEYIGKLIDEINGYLVIYKKINEDLRVTKAFLQSNAKNLYECHVTDVVVEEEKLHKLKKEQKEREREREGIKRKIVKLDTLMESNDMQLLKQRLQELTIALSNQNQILEEAASLGNVTVEELERQRDHILKQHHEVEIQIDSYKMRIDTMMKQLDQIDVLIRRSSTTQNLSVLMENIKTTQANLASLPPTTKHFAYPEITSLQLSSLIGMLTGFNTTAKSLLVLGKKAISLYGNLRRENINLEKWLSEQAKKNLSKLNRVDLKSLLDSVFQEETIISPPCADAFNDCPYYRLNQVIQQVYVDLEQDTIDEETLRSVQMIHRNTISMENALYEYNDLHLPEVLLKNLDGKEAFHRLENGQLFFDLTPFHEFAVLCKNYELYNLWSQQLQSYENQVDAYRNSDVAIQVQNKKELEHSIAEHRSKLQEIVKQSERLKDEMDTISHNSRLISERDRANDRKRANTVEYQSIVKRLEPLEHAESEKQELSFQLRQLELVLSSLEGEIKTNESRLQLYHSLTERRGKLEKISSDLELISKAVSTKTGIPVIYMKLYLNQIKSVANELLDIIYHGSFRLSDFHVTPDSFEVPYIKNHAKLADIRYASQSEVALATMALSFALSNRASNRYNIMLLDEVDGGLDEINRVFFLKMLDAQMDIIHSEQVFVISQHIEEMSTIPMDVIQLSSDLPMEEDSLQHVIYS